MKFLYPTALLSVFAILYSSMSNGQTRPLQNEKLIQFSGVVVSADSLHSIPFTNVIIRNAGRGTMTDFYGFFSFVAMKGDTIEFRSVGYKPSTYILPDTLSEFHYSIIQVLKRDTIELKEAVVYPWPSRDDFKKAFVDLDLPDDDLQRARKNFETTTFKEVQDQVVYDGSINYKYALAQRQTQLYTAGQYPINNLMNPLAWASFIQAWKDGAFRKKEKK